MRKEIIKLAILFLVVFSWTPKANSVEDDNMIYIQITKHVDALIKELSNKKATKILICPVLLGGDEDPFNKKQRLSVKGFGVIENPSAEVFVNSLRMDKDVLPEADKGLDINLLFLFKERGYSKKHLLSCRITKNNLLAYVQIQGVDYAIKLPNKCRKIVEDHFLTE